ncbi:MAG: hypothetical protein JWO09_1231 [Bacteroidetes bacterium]|nr:hypothetical protein [Bacteroidota bacterium]
MRPGSAVVQHVLPSVALAFIWAKRIINRMQVLLLKFSSVFMFVGFAKSINEIMVLYETKLFHVEKKVNP